MEKKIDARIGSIGGGRQSLMMYAANCLGELGPKLDLCVFADTQNEATWTYEAIDWARKEFGHITPLITVTAGNLAESWFTGQESSRREENAMGAAMPFHLKMPDGSKGFAMRTCSDRHKISVVRKAARKFLGLKSGQRVNGVYNCEMWLGIAWEEAANRVTTSSEEWITNVYPLVERRMRTYDCAEWMKSHGFILPKKSACVQCPYRSDLSWIELRESKVDWDAAVSFDRRLREEKKFISSKSDPEKSQLRGIPYLHASLKPLDEVDLDTKKDQMDLWGGECTGGCGT
jgi:hypothetical protein